MALFDDYFEAAENYLAGAFGDTVRLLRAGLVTEDVTAQVVITDHETIDPDTGFPVTVQSRDYLVAVEDYQFSDTVTKPRSGDLVEQSVNGETCRFQIVPIAGRPAAEWAGADGKRWLIRTKQTAAAE